MKYLVKIDRSTIKRNPNAGCQDYIIHNRPATVDLNFLAPKQYTMELKAMMLNRELLDEFALYSIAPVKTNPDFCRIEAKGGVNESSCEDLIEKLKNKGCLDIGAFIQYHHERVHSLTPEPQFTYEYEDADVECYDCGHKMKRSELETDYAMDDEDERTLDNVCPNCRMFDCCELEFEKLTNEELEKLAT